MIFDKEAIAISWTKSHEITAVKMKPKGKGFDLLASYHKSSNAEDFQSDFSRTFEDLGCSAETLVVLNGGGVFAVKEFDVPKLKPELISNALALQIDKLFPFHNNDLKFSFRQYMSDEQKAFVRVLALKNQKWNELLALCPLSSFGVDAIFPIEAILDLYLSDQSLSLNGKTYYVDVNGSLSSMSSSDKAQFSLPFELNSSLNQDELTSLIEPILLAHYTLSCDFKAERTFLSPLPDQLKPRRFEKAKKMLSTQAVILVALLVYFGYLYVNKRIETAKVLRNDLSALQSQFQDANKASLPLLEKAQSDLIEAQETRKNNFAEILLELTRLLPDNYSIKNLSYNSQVGQLTVSVRMENGQASELTNAFKSSEIFNNYPVFNDSGNRLILKLKAKEEGL